jgi:hypothetical protein
MIRRTRKLQPYQDTSPKLLEILFELQALEQAMLLDLFLNSQLCIYYNNLVQLIVSRAYSCHALGHRCVHMFESSTNTYRSAILLFRYSYFLNFHRFETEYLGILIKFSNIALNLQWTSQN